MPHQCTNCDRTFSDGSKEMLSGCPDCGGNKFQFKPEGTEPADTASEPPEPPEPAGSSSSMARTVGKTAATVKDLVGGSSAGSRADDGGPSDAERGDAPPRPDSPASPAREDTAQASARTDVVTPDELPSGGSNDEEHHFEPVAMDDRPDPATGGDESGTDAPAAPIESETPADDPDETPSGTDRPDLQELREELNDQFESIKVLQPGRYELNLMELYDREEYIVALEEDGRYSIQVPENFRE